MKWMKLDEKLVHLRKEKGLTQLELAEAVKVSRQAVSKWESGGGIPSTENLRGLSELYGVPVDYLLNGNAEKGTEERKDNPQKGQEKRKRVSIKIGLVVLALVIIVLTWYISYRNNKGKYFSVKNMVGEEVVAQPDGNFSVGW